MPSSFQAAWLVPLSVRPQTKPPCAQLLSHVQLFTTPWTVAHQAPLSIGFSRQAYRTRLPFPTPGDLSDPGIKPESPALAGRFFTTEPPGKPKPPWMTKINSRGLYLHRPGQVISSFLQSQGCVLTTPFSVAGWDNLRASPWGQALHAGQTLLPCHKPTTWLTSHMDPRCCTGHFHKFLVASSHIPPSLPFPLWGKKATISAHGNVPRLLAGPPCPQAPVSTASSVPPGFPPCVAARSLVSMCPRRALFSCSPFSWALLPVPSWPTVSRADSGPFSGTCLYCHLRLEPPCPIMISSVPVDLRFLGDTSGTPLPGTPPCSPASLQLSWVM